MQFNHIRDLARLSVPPVFIYDIWCILIFMITTMNSQYDLKLTQIDSTIIYMHAG